MIKKPQSQRPGAVSTLAPNVEAINVGSVRTPAAEAPQVEVSPVKLPAKKPVTVRLDTELIGQAHAAVLATQARAGGYDSFNALVAAAVATEVAKASELFNDGEPFPAIEGNFRRGRPLQGN
ncbi:hypothetical protein ACT3TS_17550 [Specibacter sp. AOP5-B1-6]|uniref:hypothetical protein n=1 Tax=Specibacter sp. AOP5-B1-6 TaxID=3457653 RepID=UPI00402B608F